MRWVKRGRIFDLPRGLDWAVSHAALPVVEEAGDRLRVYFSARDARGRAHIGWFEVRMSEPERILAVSDSPALGLGSLGAFDDSGVTSACLVDHGGRRHLYYSGWSLGVSVPFYFFIGLAVSEGASTFRRVSPAPVLGRSATDPFLTASPSVLVEGGVWRMWYVSATRWAVESGQPKHYYHVKYAESRDGLQWTPSGIVCIDYASTDEHAIARPCVIKEDGRYRMWYSHRGASYRIGYAESSDGLVWKRRDADVGIDLGATGWDSEMLAYPCLFRYEGRLHMLYNGNDYGRTGIGLAVLAEDE
jgi:hypothetical protein